MNELLLIGATLFIFAMALFAYKLFGATGLYCLSAVATILANIEVLILIDAFGVQQTLGNVLFAVTFLATDILSECEGKRAANRAVGVSLFASVFFLVLSQSWLLYTPSADDWASPAIHEIFSSTPRLLLASLSVYAASQFLDVWLYHKWGALTNEKFGDARRFLWLRNNASTPISQLVNTLLFTLFAFYGVYEPITLLSIFLSSYAIYICTSLLDTPVLYLARHISDQRKNREKAR